MPELFVLLLLFILSLCLLLQYNKPLVLEEKEEFTNYLKGCPFGFTSFYDKNHNMRCCDGKVIAHECVKKKGTEVGECILNGDGTGSVKNCVDVLKQIYAKKAISQCPAAMKFYYEDGQKKTKGCTASSLNETMTGPSDLSKPKCTIYSTFNQNLAKADSCFNYRKVDQARCFGRNCKKSLVSLNKNAPPVVAIDFGDNLGVVRRAYTRESYTNYLNSVNPRWRDQGIDLTRNIAVAEVAKAVYIDKTMDSKNIQI